MTRLHRLTIVPLLFLVTFVLAVQLRAQSTPPRISTEDELKTDLMLVPCERKTRADAVIKLFGRMGATESEIRAEKVKDVQNISVAKNGRDPETIVIGAHYDKAGGGCGAIDNWTGVVMTAHLYRTLRSVKTQKTYVFVAFDQEEAGLIGSARMAKSIPKESRSSYCAMVNLDSFGFTYPQVLSNTSNSRMTELAKALAADLKMPFSSASLAGFADADSSSFLSRDIPAITFHGLSNAWTQYLHNSNDQIENVRVPSVRVGYNFVLEYLKKLDSAPCGEFRK